MPDRLTTLFGPAQRHRPAAETSWAAVEGTAGTRLPQDYRRFVDGYGDATVFGHLGIPHPEGAHHPLGEFIRDLGGACLSWPTVRSGSPVGPGLERLIPWAMHHRNGDIYLLDPPEEQEGWSVVVAYRHFPTLEVYPGSVTDFFERLHEGHELPRKWPASPADWQGTEASPLI
ncbi:SMI1/KNR4 family protein [Streptomyces sp. NPDC090029]|uniref:SMI1/KNR4 family protein n=1 Tax=Streptomyces sp. NPDC090029 TaxID=3365924 RepID=UPI00381F269B